MTAGSIIGAMTIGGIAIIFGIAIIVRVLAKRAAKKPDHFMEYHEHLTQPEKQWRL